MKSINKSTGKLTGKPIVRPSIPYFSSGPCPKRPGWSLAGLQTALLSRSHRSNAGKEKLQEVIERSRSLLQLPADYRLAIVPASDTGAMEMALWSLLGERGVDLLAWESFGLTWLNDVIDQLQLNEVNRHLADYGALPDLTQVDFSNDVVFVWNGTTSGVKVPNGDWIADQRSGLTICDATSAVFAMPLPWPKIDVATFSWQKCLGSEAAHGMLILSPRAVERLHSYQPKWPLPKLFRLCKDGRLNEAIFEGMTINSPSMLAVEDFLDSLKWADNCGGLASLIKRTETNFKAVEEWVATSEWIDFLAEDAQTRSMTSVCLRICDPSFTKMTIDQQVAQITKLTDLLEKENAAFDISNHRDAPPGLRLWCGPTVETRDLECLFPWLEWAYEAIKKGG